MSSAVTLRFGSFAAGRSIYYLPNRNLTFTSSAAFSARTMNVVAYTAKFSSSWT
jgi:hypothetical protein